MRMGAVFPQYDVLRDAADIAEFARGVEELGLDHLLVYDHVLGVDPAVRPEWNHLYRNDSEFHEPFVLFGYLAAVCRLELVTGVLVLPQRQTALVAKQAAQTDWLAPGGVRLGVGLGWNESEYRALGVPFARRGARIEEQVELLRSLWSAPSVTARTSVEEFDGVGLAPRPRREIPVWLAGKAPAALARVGRIADGWFPLEKPGAEAAARLEAVRRAAREAGRGAAEIGVEPRIRVPGRPANELAAEIGFWIDHGASHLSFSTMDSGLRSVAEHLRHLESALSTVSRGG
ncbi:TIGR03619 family F420-dependent LLM class oxidoreductase [Pseudonocardia sp. NPDC049154]|uniref:TIGR03619 family F420-dependent LLM class oxidoreductase n=1 Tax=Pseudonocardia sp. NPDC049154 TaxID=3155501 RepID=UPI0033D6F99A